MFAGHFATLAVALACALSLLAEAAPAPAVQADQGGCNTIAKRVNWNVLSRAEQESYIAATKCLQGKPTLGSSLSPSTNGYDDFVSLHIQRNDWIHFQATFLPWHRWYVKVRENALRDCGFVGRLPYWDWTVSSDGKDFLHDPVFSTTTGFGGGGNPKAPDAVSSSYSSGYVVDDGPFARLKVNIYDASIRGDANQDRPGAHERLLQRGVGNSTDSDLSLVSSFGSAAVKTATDNTDFHSFADRIERGAHGALHQTIAGDMAPAQSPSDPLFFLHHAQIDRIWWQWQQVDKSRLTAYAGVRRGPDSTEKNVQVSLDDTLLFNGLGGPDPTVRSVMDTSQAGLCYTYE